MSREWKAGMENLSSRCRFRMDMSSVRSTSGTAYLIFQKLQMKECTRVRSNTTPEVEWTEADSKIREIEWRNPLDFFLIELADGYMIALYVCPST